MLSFTPNSISAAIAKIHKENSKISGDILKTATSRALNHTVSKVKTVVNQEIRKTYNIGASKINNSLKQRFSQPRTLESRITASGLPLSLSSFGAREEKGTKLTSFSRKGIASSRLLRKSRSNAIKGVSFEIKKGNEENLPTAFIQVANGGINIFARGTYKGKSQGFEFAKARMPIGKMTTTSIPLMFANDDIMLPSLKLAESLLEQRITHEITWLLQK